MNEYTELIHRNAVAARALSGECADLLFSGTELSAEEVESLSARAADLAAEALMLDFTRKRLQAEA